MRKLLIILLSFPLGLLAQKTIGGVVEEINSENEHIKLPGANVYWLNTSIGTVTNLDGEFSLPYKEAYRELVISYVGYKTDTLTVLSPNDKIKYVLKAETQLDEVTLTSRKQATKKSFLKAQNIITVSSDELLKAACCNLSESFETNPSIDVNFADAVTGTRQIKMLGLTSPYILIATENIPTIRGASQAFGLSFIPGTWAESIQITKGAGSVVNGFESIAGQINLEQVKPATDDKLFINAYGAINGRFELNTHLNTKVNDKLHTGLYIHGNTRATEFDRNNDSFLDMPLQKQINVMNRWQYVNAEKGFVSFLNFNFLNDRKQTGELGFNPQNDKFKTEKWGSEIKTNRYSVSGKLGYVNPDIKHQSMGLQTAYSFHDQNSYFGLRTYNILHNSFYSNLLYNSIIGDTRHKFKSGISFTLDDYEEVVATTNFNRNENNLGAFFEYNYDSLEKLNLTAGIRADYSTILDFFITPRLHVRYTPWDKSALRMSFGRGKRSANIFAENQNVFASARTLTISNSGGNVYGLNPEVAWNYGVSYLQGFNLFKRKADFTIDFYRTNFVNQVVVDYETPTEINFYNLNGKSYANSLQGEFNYTPFEHFDIRLAYKFYDVKTQFNSGLLQKRLTSRHRFFTNMSYETHMHGNTTEQWKFDVTLNWLSKQRLPSTITNPLDYRLPSYSPSISTLNAQITYVISPKFEIYLGGENITNVKQRNPILASDNPFGSNFDATFIYGPVFGSSYYTGLRYKLK